MWWLYTWNGHKIYAARGSEGHLVSRRGPRSKFSDGDVLNETPGVPMNEEALFPLLNEVIVPGIDGS